MARNLIIVVCFVATILSACTSSNEGNNGIDSANHNAIKETEIIKDGEAHVTETKYDANFNSSKQYIELAGKTDFAVNLAKTVGESKENFIVSPLSMQMAFAMLANGAEEDTYKEITDVIGMNDFDRDQLREYAKLLLTHFIVGDDAQASDNTLLISNSIWTKEGIPVYESFYSSTRNFFDAETYTIDFSADDASKAINEWVCTATSNKISNVVERNEIVDLIMLLVNTIYMKATWIEPFYKLQTKTFNNSNGTKGECNMMCSKRTCQYYACDDFEVASLKLGRNSYTMNFILPREGKGTATVLNSLSAEKLYKIGKESQSTYLDLMMPKFNIHSDLDMGSVMENLGIHEAFTASADFGALSPNQLMVTKVKHNTYIDVTESGVEAAAASAVELIDTSASPEANELTPVEFYIDRPFLFTIQDTSTGAVIFVGQIQEL